VCVSLCMCMSLSVCVCLCVCVSHNVCVPLSLCMSLSVCVDYSPCECVYLSGCVHTTKEGWGDSSADLTGDLGLISSFYKVTKITWNSSTWRSDALFWSLQAPSCYVMNVLCIQYTNTLRPTHPHTYTWTKKKSKITVKVLNLQLS